MQITTNACRRIPGFYSSSRGRLRSFSNGFCRQKRPFNFEIKDSMSDSPDRKDSKFMGVGICIGVAIGCGIGVAIGNLALGIGPGVAIGVVIGALISKSRR